MMRWYQQLKNVYHFFQAHWWRVYYGRPDRGLSVYGVTGTNGKTTTCYVLDSILVAVYGRDRIGMLTTVTFRVGGREEINETKLTTLPSYLVYQKLREMRAAGVTQVVLEVTSHALDQKRLAGLRLDGGIVLNIEREHLDYHGTMGEYTAAKLRILNYVRKGGTVVVKEDNKWIEKGLRQFSKHGLKMFELIHFTAEQARSIVTSLSGDWNKENVLAASLLARAAGVDEKAIAVGVQAVRQVPGRMEWIRPNDQLPRVLIDYAVTPGALERLYKYVGEEALGKIFAVLGAAGLRDRGKRPAVAKAVAKFADEIVLTREDPWAEDEEQIFSDLEQGLKDLTVSWRRVVDRREAIKYCLQTAGPDDIVVVTGKGAERGMAIGGEIIPWSDREVIEKLLAELKSQ